MSSHVNPQDHPWSVNIALVVLVALHAVPSMLGVIPNVWSALADADAAVATSVYLGFLGAASIVAGFAGVVVIFGLSGESAKFRQFRLVGGLALSRNWISTIASGFLAAGLALVAALLALSGAGAFSPWFFELGILFLIHGSVRLIWLMKGLVHAVAADDALKERQASVKSADTAPWKRAS